MDRIQLRLANLAPMPGRFEATLSSTGSRIWLARDILASSSDFTSATPLPPDRFGYSFAVEFSPSAAERLRTLTAAHLQEQIVLLVNGEPVSSFRISAPFSSTAVIRLGEDRALADRLTIVLAHLRPKLQRFQAPNWVFSIAMPGTPEPDSRKLETPWGPTDLTSYALVTPELVYLAADFQATATGNSEAVLDKARDSVINRGGAILLNDEPRMVSGFHARDVRTLRNGVISAARIVLVRDHIVIISASWSTPRSPIAKIDEFLDSLTITQ